MKSLHDIGIDVAAIMRRKDTEVELPDPKKKVAHTRAYVVRDRLFFTALNDAGVWGAFKAITKTLEMVTAGLGARAFDPSYVGGGTSSCGDGHAKLMLHYMDWWDRCKDSRPEIVRHIAMTGCGWKDADKAYKLRHGRSKEITIKCLKLW